MGLFEGVTKQQWGNVFRDIGNVVGGRQSVYEIFERSGHRDQVPDWLIGRQGANPVWFIVAGVVLLILILK